ncbi:MAG: OmpA family protein [Vicinamibacterales bacterium]
MSARTWFVIGLIATAVPAAAQPAGTASQQTTATSQATDERGRVATTVDGDAGLWWVPIADTNGRGLWRAGAARISRNTPQGHMNVANFTGAVSFGLAERVDVFASWDAITRVDRDTRALFIPSDPERGGVYTLAPYAREEWTGNKIGDVRVGTKIALLSEGAGNPFSLSARFTGTLPTAQAEAGAGLGGPAIDLTGVISKWIHPTVVLTGAAGYDLRKNPSDPVEVHVPNVMHWGAGLGYAPTPSWLFHSELMGENPVRENASLESALVAEDGSVSPIVNTVDHTQQVTAGLTWFAHNGFFVGAELRWDFPMRDRVNAPPQGRDYTDYHVRIGWSPVRRAPAPPPVTPPPPTPPAPVVPPAPAAPPPPPVVAPPVVAPPAKVYTFEDVHFDFDRYTLRPEALRLLEQAVTAMRETPTLRLTIEGHTCSIGTEEYNLALGDRRANAVREYLTSNGIAATRLVTVSFGEERPKHDNSREETRRLNRRASLVVRLDAQ